MTISAGKCKARKRQRRRNTPPTAIARVLAAFPAGGNCITRGQLLKATRLDKNYVWRKLSLLKADGLVYSHRRGCYKLTPDGEARRAVLGDAAQALGRKRFDAPAAPGFLDRLWNAMRLERRGAIGDFLRLAARPEDKAPVQSAHWFLQQLHRAGVVQRLSAPGKRPVRWGLVRDLGPRKPHLVEGRLFDPNAKAFLEGAR